MKKKYQKPAIETAELHLHTAIMSAPGNNDQPDNPGDMLPDGAPRRRRNDYLIN